MLKSKYFCIAVFATCLWLFIGCDIIPAGCLVPNNVIIGPTLYKTEPFNGFNDWQNLFDEGVYASLRNDLISLEPIEICKSSRGGEVKFRFADGELKGCILVSTEELYKIFDYKTDYYIVINDPALEGKYKAEYETKTLFYNNPELRDKNLYVCLPKRTNQIGAAKVVKK